VTMPFGKFRGIELVDLPDDYLHWLYSLPDLRDPLRLAVEVEWAMRFEPEWNPQDAFAHGLNDEELALLKRLIQTGYRGLATQFHPDLVGGDGREMRALNALMDKLKSGVLA
jgi:Putative quorum-sensing-regulated virulence factor